MRDHRERLRDVLEAIEQIEKYAVRGRPALASEELLQTWVMLHLMIIGEAADHYPWTFGRDTRPTSGPWLLDSGMSTCTNT
jgi:uncharacterized protein with HEPN domain